MKAVSDQQRKEFETLTRPLIEWLNANFSPHVHVMIWPTGASIASGIAGYSTDEFLRDDVSPKVSP